MNRQPDLSDPDKPVCKADAAFMADAPAILEALRELHDFAEPSQHHRIRDRSKAAFASAVKLLEKHGG